MKYIGGVQYIGGGGGGGGHPEYISCHLVWLPQDPFPKEIERNTKAHDNWFGGKDPDATIHEKTIHEKCSEIYPRTDNREVRTHIIANDRNLDFISSKEFFYPKHKKYTKYRIC